MEVEYERVFVYSLRQKQNRESTEEHSKWDIEKIMAVLGTNGLNNKGIYKYTIIPPKKKNGTRCPEG